MRQPESQSFNPIFKRFSNPAVHVSCYYASASSCSVRKYKSAFVNFSELEERDENSEDYNLISRTTKSFLPSPLPSHLKKVYHKVYLFKQ